MDKRGLGFVAIIFAVIVAALLTAGIYFIFIREYGAESLDSDVDDSTNISNNQTINESIAECSGYSSREDCELDSYKVGSCAEEVGKCSCIWDLNESSCGLNVEKNQTINKTNETQQSGELFFDLKALSLKLDKGSCTNIVNNATNATTKNCTVNIMGTIKNLGTNTIETDFVVHFIDVTTDSSLIELFIISDSIATQEEKNVSVSAGGVGIGRYWVQFIVDASKKIAEKDENNNFLTKSINV